MNGAIILGKRQRVQRILRIDYRPQQGYDGLRDRMPTQMQTFRSPRRDAPIHEVLRKGCAVSVSPQEHSDIGECEMGCRIQRRFVSKRSVFLPQPPSCVAENALEHPFVSLCLFVDVLRLNQTREMHAPLMLGSGVLFDVAVDPLKFFGKVGPDASKPLIVPIDNGRARPAVVMQGGHFVRAIQRRGRFKEHRTGFPDQIRQGFELLVISVPPAIDGLFGIANHHAHFVQ